MTSRNDVRGEIRQFLTTRRGKITPEQAGLPSYGGNWDGKALARRTATRCRGFAAGPPLD